MLRPDVLFSMIYWYIWVSWSFMQDRHGKHEMERKIKRVPISVKSKGTHHMRTQSLFYF